LGNFHEAHSEIDLSQVGLALNPGADRDVLAASLLRLAECLMVRADDVILECCFNALGPDFNPRRKDLSREEYKELSDNSFKNVQTLWKRCLSNWSDSLLEDARRRVHENDFSVALARAEGRLSRAKGVLDRAEITLTGARQNLEWWICLYQLRAQIEIEFLLHQITSPMKGRWGEEKSQFIARFTGAIDRGLQAIRQGLDVMLPGEIDMKPGEKEPRDVRVTRLLRMWIELMLCGGYLTQVASKDKVAEKDLWERWASLNRSVRINRLLKSEDFFREIDPLHNLPTEPEDLGIKARASIFARVKSCLRKEAIAKLVEAHKEGADK
jgi:hypothetical protein